MLRELSSGGKYFRKIVLPSAILPLFGIINGIFDKGKKDGVMRDIIPHYTMFQVIGGIVFFNALRIVLQGTELQQFINNDKAIEEFSENFIGILKHGIEKKG
jgi:hypothetical protein